MKKPQDLDAIRTYRVVGRQPILEFLLDSLEKSGCRIIQHTGPGVAPFRITFQTAIGERLGIIAYAFLANMEPTQGRPKDEHRFQVKYGSDFKGYHEIWQDPFGLYTTLMLGINPKKQFAVSADPVLHNPTRFSKSIEFKQRHVDEILSRGWFAWERSHRSDENPIEVLVGVTPKNFLRLIRFEREALREEQGNRQWLAEQPEYRENVTSKAPPGNTPILHEERLHRLAEEFELPEYQILELIAEAPRLKMAVRGWVAEHHLKLALERISGVTDCRTPEGDGQPDISLRFDGSRPITIECKNVLRKMRAGVPRLDFQRTRASKVDPCSRYYSPDDFDVIAACLHAVNSRWEFRFKKTHYLKEHKRCVGKLESNVLVDGSWADESAVSEVLRSVAKYA